MIKPPEKVEKDTLTLSLPVPVLEELKAYAGHIGATPSHVVTEALRDTFRDKEWRRVCEGNVEKIRATA